MTVKSMDYYGLIASSNLIFSKRVDVILTVEGFTCLPVYNAQELLNILTSNKFDFLIIDQSTMDKNLDELLLNIRIVNKLLPIFIITRGEEDMEEREERIYYIARSFVDEKLPEKIMAVLQAHAKK